MRADAFDRVRVGVRNCSAAFAADVLDDAMDVAAEEAGRAAYRRDLRAKERKDWIADAEKRAAALRN